MPFCCAGSASENDATLHIDLNLCNVYESGTEKEQVDNNAPRMILSETLIEREELNNATDFDEQEEMKHVASTSGLNRRAKEAAVIEVTPEKPRLVQHLHTALLCIFILHFFS